MARLKVDLKINAMKKTRKNRFLFVALSLILSVGSLLAGCGDKGGAKHKVDELMNFDSIYPIVKPEYQDEIVFDMMAPSYYTLDIDWKNNKFFKRMEELTGVKFKFDKVFNTDMYAAKKAPALSSTSQMPDFYFKAMFDRNEIVKFGGQGLIVPLEDYIKEYMPNLTALMDQDVKIRQAITAPDGHIYSLPAVSEKGTYDFTGMPWINRQWLENLSLEMPTTPEEFANVLRAFRDNDPNGNNLKDEVPMLLAGDFELNYLFSFFGIDAEMYFQINSEGKVEFGPETDRYKDALVYINSLLEEGLIKADYENYTTNQKWTDASKGEVNTVGFFIDYAAYAVVGYDKAEEYETMVTVKNEYTNSPIWYARYDVTDGLFVITKKCAYPEILCRWMDTLYDPEYAIWAEYGKEGEEWAWDDENKTTWSYLIPENERYKHMGKATVEGGGNMPFLKTSYEFLSKSSDAVVAKNARERRKMQAIAYDGFPELYLKNNTVIKQASIMFGDISKYIESVKNEAIKSGDIATAYKDYATRKKQLNVDDFLKFYQEAYDLYVNNA